MWQYCWIIINKEKCSYFGKLYNFNFDKKWVIYSKTTNILHEYFHKISIILTGPENRNFCFYTKSIKECGRIL